MHKATVDFSAHIGGDDIVCKTGDTIEGGPALIQKLEEAGVVSEAKTKVKEGKNER